jgi:hypothetical protein
VLPPVLPPSLFANLTCAAPPFNLVTKGIRGERQRLRRVEGEDMYGLQVGALNDW